MLAIRRYAEDDTMRIGVLIADTFGGFNLSAMNREALQSILGPFAAIRWLKNAGRNAAGDEVEWRPGRRGGGLYGKDEAR